VAALFLAGFATFSLLYCVQPLLPVLGAAFRVGPAESSLAVSLTTGCLALAILAAGALSRSLSRKSLMASSLVLAATLNLGTAIAPYWPLLLTLRALEGLALGGAPAVAMAYLAEEIHPDGLGRAMGLYVAGTALGGMAGRVLTGALADLLGWRWALGGVALLGLTAATGFRLLLPASRNFRPEPPGSLAVHLRLWGGRLRDSRLGRLFAIGFLAMGAFVTLYNYVGFRLLTTPYNLSQTGAGLVFTVYLFGVAASAAAGALADRIGGAPVMTAGFACALVGVATTLATPLPAVIVGVALVTIGFFAIHTVASGGVGRLAADAKGHASSLYLLFYYLGSSVMGSLGGWLWTGAGWPGVAAYVGALFTAGLLLALSLAKSSAA
jgi:MFS transporter, YNFM family, putative membrane transport protein